MASSSSSSSSSSSCHQVFLSFLGELDSSGKDFMNCLYGVLDSRGVQTLMVDVENVELQGGNEGAVRLSKAIKRSSVCVPIISRSYAASRLCLMVLAKMVECRNVNMIIIPVFYHVDPSELRKLKGPFEAEFLKHETRGSASAGPIKKKVDEWKMATRMIGALDGFSLDSDVQGHESEFVLLIVKKVLEKLQNLPLHLEEHLVGIDPQVNYALELLSIGVDDVRMIGIVGEGGIGKTTLSKVIYNQISMEFEAKSFISNVREGSKSIGCLKHFQEKLLRDIQSDDVNVESIDKGKALIRRKAYLRKVLIVLDDVDNKDQLEALAGATKWFGGGSRIIITTRNDSILSYYNIPANRIYCLKRWSFDNSIKLLNYHAFRSDQPTKEYVELSQEIASISGGLPLELEVMGSLLFDQRDPHEWKELLGRLRDKSWASDRLKLSYDGLTDQVKNIFVDIACFFVNCDKYSATTYWQACNMREIELAIKTLQHRRLIKISSSNKFQMHDLIQNMGRSMYSQLNLPDTQRFWNAKKILNLLNGSTGKHVEGIDLDNQATTGPFRTESFRHMIDLKFLRANGVVIQGNFGDMPTELKWLEWRHCPLKALPSNFNTERLVVLDLSKSDRLTHLWNDGSDLFCKVNMNNLRILDLSDCIRLKATPNFSSCHNLEKLFLKRTTSLSLVDESIGDLKRLLVLDLNGSGIDKLPDSIGFLQKLCTLDLSNCKHLRKLPSWLGDLRGLNELHLTKSDIWELPESLGYLDELHTLNLNECRMLECLPESIGHITELSHLDLSASSVRKLPDSVGLLHGLHTLDLSNCEYLRNLPDSIGNMKWLRRLSLEGVYFNREIPESMGSLHMLQTLELKNCRNLRKLPDSLGQMKALNHVDVSMTSIEELPESIGSLHALHTLILRHCGRLRSLPNSFGQMKGLNLLNLSESGIKELPKSIEFLHQLHTLNLGQCKKLTRLPNSLGEMEELRELILSESGIEELPKSIGFLHQLHTLNLGQCKKLTRLPDSLGEMKALTDLILFESGIEELPKSIGFLQLHTLNLGQCKKLTRLPDSLGEMKAVTELILSETRIKELPTSLPHHLEILDISYTHIEEVPNSDGCLGNLKLLNIKGCCKFECLPFESMKRLEVLEVHAHVTLDGHEYMPPFTIYRQDAFKITMSSQDSPNSDSIHQTELRRLELMDFHRDFGWYEWKLVIKIGECQEQVIVVKEHKTWGEQLLFYSPTYLARQWFKLIFPRGFVVLNVTSNMGGTIEKDAGRTRLHRRHG